MGRVKNQDVRKILGVRNFLERHIDENLWKWCTHVEHDRWEISEVLC